MGLNLEKSSGTPEPALENSAFKVDILDIMFIHHVEIQS